jgi:hypothetical protein
VDAADFTVAVDALATLVTAEEAVDAGEVVEVVVVASSAGLLFGDAGVGTSAETFADGVFTLFVGVVLLTAGVVTLPTGVVTLTDGVVTLTDGTLPAAGAVVEVVELFGSGS